MKATIRDVARAAGVSVATVSRILNSQDGYSPDTKQKVEDAIRRLDYRINAVARGLSNRSTRTIGVLIPTVTDSFASWLIEGIEDVAHRQGYSVILCNTASNGSRTRDYLRVLAEKRVEGILFVSEWLKEEYGLALQAMKVPVVLVSTMSTRFAFPYVKIDDKGGAYQAVRYLIERGHRSIGLLSGPQEDPIAGLPRLEGWREALRDSGLSADDRQIAFGDFHFFSGVEATRRLWAAFPEMTALFAVSDMMALGAISFAYDAGISVPQTLSVVGFDDGLAAESSIPPLTSVHQPLRDLGVKAAELLFASAEGGVQSLILPVYVRERRSVAAPRS